MVAFYVAVIFFCTKGNCDFAYSPKTYSNRAECTVDVNTEIRNLQKADPNVKLGAACLEFKIPSA